MESLILNGLRSGTKKCVAQYNIIVKETGAKCVVTSSWRVNRRSIKELQELFWSQGLDVEVIGFTPVLNEERGFEIKTWLEDHRCDKYVIIDDKTDDILPYFPTNVIRPVSYIGLTKELANNAINVLKSL